MREAWQVCFLSSAHADYQQSRCVSLLREYSDRGATLKGGEGGGG